MATIRIEGLDDFQRDLRRVVNEMPSLSKQAIGKSTRHIKKKVQDKIVSEGIPFTGELQKSVYAPTPSATGGTVYVGKKYGLFVETGTRPHFPPVEPLERWASIKLGQPGMGYVIARKIGRVGTKKHPYFMPAVKDSLPQVQKYFEQMVDMFVKQLGD